MEEINASIGFDKKLYAQDIARFNRPCHHAGRIKASFRPRIADKIVARPEHDQSEIESGNFEFSRKLEDIHMNVEARLAELIGPAAGRLHTARSRNDQVALDFRLWVKDELQTREQALTGLIAAFLDKAEEHADTVMPGFTHLQTAQPVTFGHHCMAYVEMFGRDRPRVRHAIEQHGRKPARRRGAGRHRPSRSTAT